MSQGRKVLHSLPNASFIIDANVADARQIRSHVHKYQRYLPKPQVLNQRIFHPEGKHRNSVDTTLNHPSYGQLHPPWIMHRGSEQDFIVLLDRQVLERLDNLRKERIGDFGNDESEEAALTGDQAARLAVEKIPKLLGGLPHALGKMRTDRRDPVECARYGRSGNPRFLGDIAYVHRGFPRGL